MSKPPTEQEVARSIDPKLIELWKEVPPFDPLKEGVTRADVDRLFFGINMLVWAHIGMEKALVAGLKGDVVAANESLHAAHDRGVKAANFMTDFMEAIIKRETEGKPHE